jgi:hypothetical protein
MKIAALALTSAFALALPAHAQKECSKADMAAVGARIKVKLGG